MANNTIYIKKTAVAGRAPTTSNIGQGELAVNMTDQKLFSTNGSVVFEIGANLTSSMVGNSTANVTSNTTMLRIANSTASANLTPDSLTIGTSTVNSAVIQAATLAANGNVTLGTQANKATVTYTTNTARTYTLPDAGANASFVMSEGTQTINGAKTFSGGIGVREGSPSVSSAAVFTYTVGHSNATRYGLLNTLNIDNSTGDLTADRAAIGVSSIIESSIQNSLAFNHNIRAFYGIARTSANGGNSIDGEGTIYAGDFSVLHQSNDPTYNKIQQARGVYGSVQTTGNTATINTAIGVYSTINPTNATSIIDTGYLFFGINGSGTGTYNKRWGVYISSPINNYFNGGLQVGGTPTGSTSSAGLGVGVAPSGTSGTISMNGNLTGVANLVLGTQANKATVTYSTDAARVYSMPDAGADASFVMSEGTQTINGAKTFSNANLSGPLNNTSANNRDKLRVWSQSAYTIGMSTPFTFGAIDNDYAMTFQMNNASTRGFWWGDNSHANSQGAMALSTDGKLTVATALRVGYGESDTTIPSITTTLDLFGNVRVTGAYYDSTNSTGTAGQVLTSNSTHSYWAAVGAATNLVLTGSVTEDVDNTTYTAVTGSVALSAAAGTVQVWTLSGSVTSVTDSLSSGQYITLMIADGTAYTITWGTTVTWVGGTAPTLATTGYTVIEIWKVGTVVYGAYIGAVA